MTNSNPSQSFFDPTEEDSIDFKRYFSLFISNWYWFAISLFIALSIAYGINRWSEKVYTVSSSLLIKDDKFGGSSSDLTNIFPGTNAFKSQQNLKNEIGILKSFNLNYRVMQELPDFYINYVQVGKRGIAETRMYKSCPFSVVYNTLNKQNFGQKVEIRIISDQKYLLKINEGSGFEKELSFGENFNEMGFDFTLRTKSNFHFNSASSYKFYFYFIDLTSLANSYRGKLAVSPIDEDASLVTLTTSGYVPEQEADYLNMLMDIYLRSGLEFKNQTASQTINFIESQLGTISDSLKIAERDLESFRLYNKLIDISREGSIIQGKFEQIDAEKTKLLLQKKYYQYLRNYIESKNETGDIVAPSVMGVTDPLMIKLVDEYSVLQLQKKKLAMNLEDSMEPLRMIEANIESNRRSIFENINDGFRNIENSIADADNRLLTIDQDIKKLPSTERQMINIQRKFDINNTVYTFLLEKRAEAGIAKASNVSDNRIIDRAGFYSSSRVKPRKSRNLLIATILGLFIPIGGIFLVDFMNNKVLDKNDILKRTTIPIIGYISHNNLKTELPVLSNPGSTLSESFRSVRTNLKYFLKEAQCPIIAVCSTITAEGKTFVSSNLSSILALSGKKILLVGLDLRKPRIHKIFGLSNEIGVSSHLIGESLFEDVVIKTQVENLWYAPSGPVPPNPAELIESEAMTHFFEKARQMFDYIIIDTPPIAIVTDSLLISQYTDFYLFVVRQRYTSKNTLELLEELNGRENIKSIGIVMNDINLSGYYGYGLRYGYPMGYGYNYGYNYYTNYGKYGYSDSGKGYYTDKA